MASVSFIRHSAGSGGGNPGAQKSGDSIVRIAFSPRRRNYRAMSAASQQSCSGVTVVSSRTPNKRNCCPSAHNEYCCFCTCRLPVLFERSAHTWWDPKFDSEVLEGQLWRSSLPQVRRRLRWALLYMTLVSVAWGVFITVRTAQRDYGTSWPFGIVVTIFAVGALIFVFPFKGWFLHEWNPLIGSLCTALLLCGLSLFIFLDTSVTDSPPLAPFCACIQVLIILYTAIPLPLYLCILIGLGYSFVFELLAAFLSTTEKGLVLLRLFLHMVIHLIGLQIFIMTQVRMRSTFLKVGQLVLVRRDLELEKQLKEKMIHSVMPPSVAHWLITEGPADDEEVELADGTVRKLSSPRVSTQSPGTTNEFRPFNMNRMENVSILFADIVGFTRMSSNKSAEQLVGLLNDLFGQFDQLCEQLGCEKINTLGDCYYCVSGCPEPREDHARCCVRMGLAMIRAVRQFDEDTGEDVNMRVGVHTGTVLCGIVGTRRFKFDVWSNNVTLANHMESTGRPGRVHLSHETYTFLNDEYYVEEGEPYKGQKTYFIIGSKNEVDGIPSPENTWSSIHPPQTKAAETNEQLEQEMREAEISVIISNDQDTLSPTIETELPKKTSLTQSWSTLNSRKDSGIRSRRSSIQAQLMEANAISPELFLEESGTDYYNSSQMSVTEGETPIQFSLPADIFLDLGMPLNESLTRFHLLRKQSDLQMIKCIQKDSTHIDYFMKPPINRWSLFFLDPEIEAQYRERAHRQETINGAPTLASSSFSTYFDIFVAAVVYIIIAISCFILFSTSLLWLMFCCIATCTQLLVVTLCIRQLLTFRFASEFMKKLYVMCSHWYPWHICGAILISLPIISVFTNFTCDFGSNQEKSTFFCYLIFIALIHFCNFTQLNCWMKSFLASSGGLVFIFLLSLDVCPVINVEDVDNFTSLTINVTDNFTTPFPSGSTGLFPGSPLLRDEAVLSVVLLLLLIWYLNREFEISYRISFHGSLLAEKDQQKIQILKDQADWLLHNIIPKHVAEHIKTTSKYSENHENVGIIFASIVNFNELYDETYRFGKECLRILNEVIGDFDELLHRPEFRNIEKIKTIGSTFMAASGLNPKIRRESAHVNQHLFELMDFAIALQKVIQDFNDNLLGFNFELRIGYNIGDVTAGVIGTTKLFYDIWGDAVNIASRMDSTGLPGKIQIPEHCVPILEEVFICEPRGAIYVKGKDYMNVYTLVKKKDGIEYRTPRKSDGCVSQHSVQFCH